MYIWRAKQSFKPICALELDGWLLSSTLIAQSLADESIIKGKESIVKQRLVRLLICMVIGVGILVGGIWLLCRSLEDRDVLYQGKSRYYWSEEFKKRNPATTNEVVRVLNQEIIPRLTKTMFEDTNDSPFRISLVDNLNALPGIHIFYQVADGRRADAAAGLGEFGPWATSAIPALLQAFQSQDAVIRVPAAISLGKIHAQPDFIIPLLINNLEKEDFNESAAEALGEYGNLAKAAIPKLIALLPVRDKDLHHAIQEALAKIDPEKAARLNIPMGSELPADLKSAVH